MVLSQLSLTILALGDSLDFILGELVPSILIGVGFLPELLYLGLCDFFFKHQNFPVFQTSWDGSHAAALRFHEFISSMSIEGYSFGVTFFDVVGSLGNTAVYFMREVEPVPVPVLVGVGTTKGTKKKDR